MKRALTLIAASAALSLAGTAMGQNLVLNGSLDTDATFWNNGGGGTVAHNTANDNTGNGGGSLAVTVATAGTDNSSVSSNIDGSVQFNGFNTGAHPATLLITAYVFVDTPLVEAPGISGGNGGASVALIDGAIDFTGVITPDADRVLDNAAFEEITAPVLTLQAGGRQYHTWLINRCASGTAYYDDISVVDGSTSVQDWDIY